MAIALPAAELLVAAALLFVDSVWPAYVAVAVFVAFTVVLIRRIARDDRRPCNCFGAASSRRSVSTLSLVRNGWFLVLAILATGTASVHEPTAVGGNGGARRGVRRDLGRAGGAHVTADRPEERRVVVLTGTEAEAEALGVTARALEADGHRTVVFVGDVTTDAGRAALRELLAELFPTP